MAGERFFGRAAHDGKYITGVERHPPSDIEGTSGSRGPAEVAFHPEFVHPSVWRSQVYWDRREEGRRPNPTWVRPFQQSEHMREFPPGSEETGMRGGKPEQKSDIFEPLAHRFPGEMNKLYMPFQPGIDPLPPNPPMYQ
jgi:hypothetical protein